MMRRAVLRTATQVAQPPSLGAGKKNAHAALSRCSHGATPTLPHLAAAPQRWVLGVFGARGARPSPPRAAAQPSSCPRTATKAGGVGQNIALSARTRQRARQSTAGPTSARSARGGARAAPHPRASPANLSPANGRRCR